jgi:hypothetical protein
MTAQSDFHGDRILDSLAGRLQVAAIVAIGVAAVAIWGYLLW